MICGYCRSEIPDDSVFCSVCGQKLEAVPAAQPEPVCSGYNAQPVSPAAPKKKGKGLKIGLLSGAITLALAAVVVLLWLFLASGGPMTEIAVAAINTLTADSVTIELNAVYDGTEVGGLFQLVMDPEERALTMYADVDVEGEQTIMAIYDGYLISEYFGRYWAVDISDQLDEFFDAYEEFDLEEIDWQELLESIEDGLYEEAQEYVDFDLLQTCLTAYGKSLNDKDWLEENAGFSESGRGGVTYYTFEPDAYDFVYESFIHFEDAFRDADVYGEALDELKDSKSEMRDLDLELTFGIDGDELTSLELDVDIDGDVFACEIDFSSIGKTDIDMDELEDMLEDAQIY